MKSVTVWSTIFWATLVFFAPVRASDLPSNNQSGGPLKPDALAKCPVCGMFVAKYPDFLSEVIFKDGSYVVFDGVKDMMKFYFNLARYQPSYRRSDIVAIYVTDYYRLTWIDGRRCYYVIGSDVFGPMGKELIPFEKEEEAKQFMSDHRGQKLLTFSHIDSAVVKTLE